MRDLDCYACQHAVLDALIASGPIRDQALVDLHVYYQTGDTPSELFTGRRFDAFDGGGDTAAVCNSMTSADVLSISLLSIERRLGRFALDVLETRATEINELLAKVRRVSIFEVTAADYDGMIGKGSPAWRLWEVLCACGGTRRTTSAHKLLARKRPHLLPVYDRVVQKQLVASNNLNIWECLWSWFYERPDRVAGVTQLRRDAGDIAHISLLRTVDVALWMRGKAANR